MEQGNVFFISHRSKDNEQARLLQKILFKYLPEGSKIFLDCSDELPIESSEEWLPKLFAELEQTRFLIFLASDPSDLKDGSGYMYTEISYFYNLKNNRNLRKSQFNESYFGIFLCDCDFEIDLFSDTKLGSMYRGLYNSPEHLLLGPGGSVADAEARIQAKVQKLLSGEEVDETAALILDEVRAYTAHRAESDEMFRPSAIDDGLLPLTKLKKKKQSNKERDNRGKSFQSHAKQDDAQEHNGEAQEQELYDEQTLDFSQLCQQVQKNHIALIGTEGGCGKTTILTKLFYHYLQQADPNDSGSMIPLYVDAKNLMAPNHLLLRYLDMILFDSYTAMSQEGTSKNAATLDAAFSQKREQPRYLLIIDGYNEIPDGYVAKVDQELQDFLPNRRYSNVRVIISGRHVSGNLSDTFKQVTVQALDDQTVTAYLWKNRRVPGKPKSALSRILSIPMYLKLYAQTSSEGQIQNKADLLSAYVKWQLEKDLRTTNDAKTRLLYQILSKHVLPVLAHSMLMKDMDGSSFVLTERELEDSMLEASRLLQGDEYRRFYGRDYRNDLKNSGFTSCDALDLSDLCDNYFVQTCRLLRRDSSGEYSFSHQIYRDFFCAQYIAEDIRRSTAQADNCASLTQKLLNEDITGFIAELLKEGLPRFNIEAQTWDYSCNESSQVLPLLNTLRGKEDTAFSVANVLEILKIARNTDLSGLDLSGLDLTQSLLRGCQFSRYDASERYATSFANAKLDRRNIFTENHFERILAACSNDTCVACVDGYGDLKLWERKRVVQFPLKIITGLRYAISKMLFSHDGNTIYALTDHEILEVPIPEAFSSVAQHRIVFETATRLRDMIMDEAGRLYFTTTLNPFNYKPVDDPNAADTNRFYGICSAAAVSARGDRLALGHITGYECLKLYRRQADGEGWKEQRFGYSAVLHEFIGELETLFRRFGLYALFPTDNEDTDARRTYFSYIQQQFEDRNHDHHQVPGLIVKRCLDRLENKYEPPVRLDESQSDRLQALVQTYAERLQAMAAENNLLMLISGRNVTSMCFKEDGVTLLLACALDYNEKLRKTNAKGVDTVVLELNTDTMATRFVTRYWGDHALRTVLSGKDILVLSKFHVTAFDEVGNDLVHVTCYRKSMRRFLSPPGKDSFFAITQNFIYELDLDMFCRKSFANSFKTTRIVHFADSQGREYLAEQRYLDMAPPDGTFMALELTNGTYHKVSKQTVGTITEIAGYAEVGNMRYKECAGRLVSFRNAVKEDELEAPFKLLVCGCDFRGVQGNVTEPRYMRMLYRMGAQVDDTTLPTITVESSTDSFTPSETPLTLPKDIATAYVPYKRTAGLTLEEDCLFSDAVGGNQLYVQKTWAMINKGSYSGRDLEETDYSILEWVWQLNFAQADMIAELLEAGIIETPTLYQDVSARLEGTLHQDFKFVFRSRFCVNGEGRPTPIYTVCFPYGKYLLRHITGQWPQNQLYISYNPNKARKRIPGRKDEFIVIDGEKRLKSIRETLALGRWFTITASRYKALLRDYSLNTVFDTDSHFDGRGNIHGYVRLGDQSFFAQEFRSFHGTDLDWEIAGKVRRMCILAVNYRNLTRYGQQLHKLTRQPALILIGESLEQCRLLNNKVAHLYPNVRKLYTFDALLTSQEAFAGAGCYLEFVNGQPRSVKLEDLL